MSVTREELAAFADGELPEPRRSEVAVAVAADAALAEQLERHRALKERLAAHFAPILDQPVPEGLIAPLGGGEPKVTDFTAARQRKAARGIPRRGWIVGSALAASLALAVLLPRGEGYAGPRLAEVLDGQLVATQASDAPTRILLSFQNSDDQFCRAFAGEAQSGIACKDASGWRLRATVAGAAAQTGDYRTAGSASVELMAKAQAMAVGPALTAEEERAARAQHWHS
jgi:hypothetical protein